MMKEKSIDGFVKEVKAAFGDVQFKAVRHRDGLTIASKGWIDQPAPAIEISGEDFIKLGNLGQRGCPSKGVLPFFLKRLISKK